jgi:AcrR family transcriptional regulator
MATAVSATSTRTRLLEAAADVFAEKGYDGTRVQEIARRAGLTTGAIYANFAGKADLLLEAIDTLGAHALDALLFDVVSGRSPAETLVSMGVTLSAPGDDRARALLFEALGAARRDPDVAGRLQAHFEQRARRLTQLIADGRAAGELSDGLDVDAAVRFCLALALGFLACDLVGVAPVNRQGWESVVHRTVAAFGPVPAARSPHDDAP